MSKNRLRPFRLGSALALGASLSASALAQVPLDRYSAPATPVDGLALSRPVALAPGQLTGLLALDFADDPLVLELERGLAQTETTRLVDHQLEAHARVAYGLFERLVLTAGIDAALVMVGERYDDPGTGSVLAPADGAGIGDARLGARYVLLGSAESSGALAVEAHAMFPLARGANSDQQLSGERGLAFAPRLAAELRPGAFRFTANTGVIVRRDTELLDTRLGDELTYGLGAGVQLPGLLSSVELLAEVYGSTAVSDPFAAQVSPLEALGGARYRPSERWLFSLAGGSGIQRGLGSPDVRALASVGFVGDAIVDTDADGTPDAHDACPFEAEDRDGHEDGDGCPEVEDQDRDGVLDAVDACPNAAEDLDGFQDADGCPDPDNDADGVPDESDRCPLEPGVAEQAGCAPAPTPAVEAAPEPPPVEVAPEPPPAPIEIGERVMFAPGSSRFEPGTAPTLAALRAVFDVHAGISRVAVVGHADASGDGVFNQRLSEERAQSVARWLVDNGVARERLAVFGCGESRPRADESTPEGRQQNRRVELVVLEPPSPAAASLAGCRELSD